MNDTKQTTEQAAQLAAMLCAVLVVAIGLWPARLAGLSRDAARSTRVPPGPRSESIVLQEPMAAGVESATLTRSNAKSRDN